MATKAALSYLDDTVTHEFEILKERNKISNLEDLTVQDGDRHAYDALRRIEKGTRHPNLADAASASISRIKTFYMNRRRVDSVRPIGVAEGISGAPDERMQISVLTSHLKSHPDWKMRADAARMLASKDWEKKGVPEALLAAARRDRWESGTRS